MKNAANAARLGGGQKRRIDAQHGRGKLTARERIELLLDEGSFEEFDMFVSHRCTEFGMEKQKPAGDGVVTGWGTINGRMVYVCSARISPCLVARCRKRTRRKSARSWIWPMQNGAPIIGINDSGGARIQEGVASLAGYAEVFQRNITGVGRGASDQRDHGPLCGWCGVQPGDDRLYLHGEGLLLHVCHRPGRGEDRDE